MIEMFVQARHITGEGYSSAIAFGGYHLGAVINTYVHVFYFACRGLCLRLGLWVG
jgi:hypothetical protein